MFTIALRASLVHAATSSGPAPAAASAKHPFTVLAVPDERGLDAGETLGAIRDHATGMDVVFERGPTLSGDRRPLATAIELGDTSAGVFWVERGDEGLTIYLYEPRGQGVYIREVVRGTGETDAALLESVAVIVASTAVAVQRNEALGMRKADPAEVAALKETTEPVPVPVPVPVPDVREEDPPPPRVRGRVGVGYVGESFESKAPWQSGIRVHGAVLPGRLLRVGLGYGFLAPISVSGDYGLRLTRHEIALALDVGTNVARKVTLHGSLHTALQLVRWTADGRSGLRSLGRIGPMLEVGIELTSGLFLDIGLGAVFSLNTFAFVECDTPGMPCVDDMREVAARPWPIAPRATAGLSYVWPARRASAGRANVVTRGPAAAAKKRSP